MMMVTTALVAFFVGWILGATITHVTFYRPELSPAPDDAGKEGE